MFRFICTVCLLWRGLALANLPQQTDFTALVNRWGGMLDPWGYDGMLPVQELDTNSNVLVTYTRGPDVSGSLAGAGGIGGLLARTDGNGSTFYHADGAGNITSLIDGNQNIAARYLYSAFGRLIGQWGPLAGVNEMQFSSMPIHRQSGISVYPFRAYDSGWQRWLNRDPFGEAGGMNLYGFVGNNPISYVDPYGLDFHVTGASGLLTPGPVGYLYGDTALESLAAGGYNTLPEVENILANAGQGLVDLLSLAGQTLGAIDDASARSGLTSRLGLSPSDMLMALGPLAGEARLARASKCPTKASALDRMLEAGKTIDKGDLTKAGRALQKHGSRPGSVFPSAEGNPAAINLQGQQVLQDILSSPNQVIEPNRFGGRDVFDVTTGRGVRYDANGNLMGFLEP
jgi:RHS repeat-associated protein